MLQRILTFSHRLWKALFLFCALALAPLALAQEEGDQASAQSLYVDLEPEFVLNYGQASRLHFARIQVTVVAADTMRLPDVSHHTPALRHIVVMTISAADRATITAHTGRRELRAELLQKMQAYMESETDDPAIADVLFRNFIVQ